MKNSYPDIYREEKRKKWMKNKKKILWLSRHDLTTEQASDLERIYGDIEIKKVSVTVESAKDVVACGSDCDIFAVVLPDRVLQELIKRTNKPIIMSVACRMFTGKYIINPATGKHEKEYMFRHRYWERIKKFIRETEIL